MKFDGETSLFYGLFDAIPFGIYVADIQTLELIYVNQAMHDNPKGLVGKPCYQAIYGENSPCRFCNIKHLLDSQDKPNGQTLVHERFNEATDRWFQLQDKCMGWPDGRLAKYSIAVDISDLKKAQNSLAEAHAEMALFNKQLEQLSVTDTLTKLFNRAKLDQVIAYELTRSRRAENPFSLIILDVDKFKEVNDTYGHQAGDEVLKSLAELLKSNIRASDTLGRWGGEEFVIICPDTDSHAVKILGEKLRNGVEQHTFPIVGQKTASFGMTSFVQQDTESSMVERADRALYLAKEQGRNATVFQ